MLTTKYGCLLLLLLTSDSKGPTAAVQTICIEYALLLTLHITFSLVLMHATARVAIVGENICSSTKYENMWDNIFDSRT